MFAWAWASVLSLAWRPRAPTKNDGQVIDAEGLFPRSTTWIGYRKNTVLRRYMFDFIRLFASHVSSQQLDDIRRASSQEDIDDLFDPSELPVLGGCDEGVTEAA